MPTIDMTKNAGPSPESAKAKSSPQESQRGLRGRKPAKSGPAPQRGHRPFSPARMGDGAAMVMMLASNEKGGAQSGRDVGAPDAFVQWAPPAWGPATHT